MPTHGVVVTSAMRSRRPAAVGLAALFMIIRNGTPHRAPAAGDVLSLSAAPGFDSVNGGHSAVVQTSSVGPAGNGSVTVVEENADASGVAVLPVRGWRVLDPGFRYAEWPTARPPNARPPDAS